MRLPGTLAVLATVAEALGYAHENGIVHRDIKPGNILLDKEGRPYLTDFGLAKDASAISSMTETGAAMGTPLYMSPEQARGRAHDATPASDVFAMGVVLYEVLTGRVPFDGETTFDLCEAIVRATPLRPTEVEPSTPAELERICLQALEKDPANRYPSGRELARDLRQYLKAGVRGETDLPTLEPLSEEDLAALEAAQPPSRIWYVVGALGAVAAVSVFLVISHFWASWTTRSLDVELTESEEQGYRYLAAADALNKGGQIMTVSESSTSGGANFRRKSTDADVLVGKAVDLFLHDVESYIVKAPVDAPEDVLVKDAPAILDKVTRAESFFGRFSRERASEGDLWSVGLKRCKGLRYACEAAEIRNQVATGMAKEPASPDDRGGSEEQHARRAQLIRELDTAVDFFRVALTLRPESEGERWRAEIVRTENEKMKLESHPFKSAVLCALIWLARHQSPDGSWKAATFTDQCIGSKCGHPGASDYDAGETGLALFAFLGAGYTHLSREEVHDHVTGKTIKLGDVVKNAIRWLVNNQDADGCIGPKVSKMMYNHSICTLALSEAYGMTESPILKDHAQMAIDYLVQAKNPYKAWRYSAKCGDNDSSVTGWCVMALKSAELSNLNVAHSTLVEAKAWMDEITDRDFGNCGYRALEDAGVKVVYPGKNDDYTQHGGLAAVGMVVRTFVDHDRKDPILEMSAKLLSGDLPVWDQAAKTNDYCYWHWGTLALFQYDGPDSGGSHKYWNTWNQAVTNALVKNQKTEAAGCADGSWDADDRWGWAGGRVYATALNALTLEVYYRYANAYSKK